MLAVVQAGQAGKTKLLIEMHRQRKRVFRDRLGWNVTISNSGLEIDQFDLPEAIYVLSIDGDGRVNGSWRLLPANGPTMIRDIWPQFLDSIPMPCAEDVWEGSRFWVDAPPSSSSKGLARVSQTTQELFIGVTELCLHCGIREVFTLYDMRIARILQRLDCRAEQVSQRQLIDGQYAEVGRFKTDRIMLERLRHTSGLSGSLLDKSDLPPFLPCPNNHFLGQTQTGADYANIAS